MGERGQDHHGSINHIILVLWRDKRGRKWKKRQKIREKQLTSLILIDLQPRTRPTGRSTCRWTKDQKQWLQLVAWVKGRWLIFFEILLLSIQLSSLQHNLSLSLPAYFPWEARIMFFCRQGLSGSLLLSSSYFHLHLHNDLVFHTVQIILASSISLPNSCTSSALVNVYSLC